MRKEWFLLGILAFQSSVSADQITGLIGGNDDAAAYGALVYSETDVRALPGLPSTGEVDSVSINDAGVGLIGGSDGGAAYGALVYSETDVRALPGLPSSKSVLRSVSINDAGVGLIGGSDAAAAYGAFVYSETDVRSLSGLPSGGSIFGVSINDAGVGLIGGNDAAAAYGAFVYSGTDVRPISGSFLPAGYINSVSINDAGVGLIGGRNNGSGAAYAALVYSETDVRALSGLPDGAVLSVSINVSGIGLIGEANNSGAAYGALVYSETDVRSLSGLPSTGRISSVSINDAGVGLIGGENDTAAYGALVYSETDVRALTGLPSAGSINSVSINDAGVGLIGGNDDSGAAYAAIVSPSGVVTGLPAGDLPAAGMIRSVAIANANNAIVPQSIGPYASAIYSQLAASEALELRLTTHSQWPRDFSNEVAARELPPCPKQPKYTFWAEPFGNYIHLKKQGRIPNYTNTIGGALAAFDYHTANLLLGGGLGYAFNYVHYSESQGHGKIHEELACFYSSFKTDCAWIDAAIWGGLYQFHNERHMLSFITSTAHTHGWILSPHLEAGAPCDASCCTIEPFARFDWTNAWQSHYTEHGASGLNVVMDGQYASLLQSELGLRFFETTRWCWGKCQFEEKLSFVNQAPFHFEDKNVFFVASVSTFPVATGSDKVQNLGSAQFVCSFLPNNQAYPFVIIDLNGQFGTSLQSYFASLQIGKDF